MMWNLNAAVLFPLLILAFGLTIEIAWRLGARRRLAATQDAKNHLNALQASILGLLALLLGFTFAMAQSRYDNRKSLVLQEANAIGTAYLRTRLLPDPDAEVLGNLFGDYVDARLAFYEAGTDVDRIKQAAHTGAQIQNQVWMQVKRIMDEDPQSERTGLLASSVNDMIDVGESRQVALENHVPEVILHLLLTVSVGALGFIAYGNGMSGPRRHGSTALFGVLIALVLLIILDLDRPRRGLVRVSQASMERLQQTIDVELGR